MTREQKLEAALREVRSYILSCSYGETMRSIIDTAVATPPTSEWNEAIEAAAQMVGCSNGSVPYLVYSIRLLKRKEQL